MNAALKTAIRDSNIRKVRNLLKTTSTVNLPLTLDVSLQAAINSNSLKVVKLLLDAGADVNFLPKGRWFTPLAHALASGRYDIARLLIQRGADVNKPSRGVPRATFGNVPLYYAIRSFTGRPGGGSAPIGLIRELILNGACKSLVSSNSAHVLSKQGELVLELAISRGAHAIFELLLSSCKIPVGTRINGRTFLHLAAFGTWTDPRYTPGAVKIIRFLIRNGLDPNVKDKHGIQPLALATNTTIRNALIKFGPRVRTTKRRVRTYSTSEYVKKSKYSHVLTRVHETPGQISAFRRMFQNVDMTDEYMGEIWNAAENFESDGHGSNVVISAQLRDAKTKKLKLAGAVLLKGVFDSNIRQPFVYIEYLTTLQWARNLGVGVGSALIDATVQYTKEHGGKTIRLYSVDTEKTLRFYERIGFTRQLHPPGRTSMLQGKNANQEVANYSLAHANRIGMRYGRDFTDVIPGGTVMDSGSSILDIKRYETKRAAFLRERAPRKSMANKGARKNNPEKPNTPRGTNTRKRSGGPDSSAKRHKGLKVAR